MIVYQHKEVGVLYMCVFLFAHKSSSCMCVCILYVCICVCLFLLFILYNEYSPSCMQSTMSRARTVQRKRKSSVSSLSFLKSDDSQLLSRVSTVMEGGESEERESSEREGSMLAGAIVQPIHPAGQEDEGEGEKEL
jgi:hypothetical protein